MKKIKKIEIRHGFWINVITLASGSVVSQILVFLTLPILTRIYTPGDFGILATFTSIVSIVSIVAALRYELAIPLPENETIAANTTVLCLINIVLISIVSGLGILLLSRWIIILKADIFKWLIPVGILGTGLYQVFTYWSIRRKYYNYLARTKVIRSMGMVSTQLGMGLTHFGVSGLLIGDVVGRICGSSGLIWQSWCKDKNIFNTVSCKGIKESAVLYRRFPIYLSAAGLLNTGAVYLPVLFLAGFWGHEVAGWFDFAQKTVLIPLSIISQSTAQVYLGEAAKIVQENPQSLRLLFYKTIKRLFIYGSIPIIILVLIAPMIFSFIFGEEWLEAGRYVQVLAVMFLADFIFTPVSPTLNILNRQNWQLGWDGLRFLLTVLVFVLINTVKWSAYTAIALYGILMIIFYIILGLLINKAIYIMELDYEIYKR